MAEVDDDVTSARFEPLRDAAGECVLLVAGEVDLSNATKFRSSVVLRHPQTSVLRLSRLLV